MDEAIEEQLKCHNIKKDKDITELYLASKNIELATDLSRFKFLKHVWLNDNKLSLLIMPRKNLTFVHNNCRISELYLQNNDLRNINNSISHLRCLTILFLQNNQLSDLDHLTQELCGLQALKVLYLFDNPLAQIPGYRLHIIYNIPSIELLDRKAVTNEERYKAKHIYEEQKEAIKATIAFGRRSLGPPSLYFSNKGHKINSHQDKEFKEENDTKNTLDRSLRRSIMQYTTMDWSCVLSGQQRRLGEVSKPPQNVTIKFR